MSSSGPHPGRYPANPYPRQALTRPFTMDLAQPMYLHNSSQSDRSYWENPWESGNENRRRNVRRVRAEKAHNMRHPHMHAGYAPLGRFNLGGHGPIYPHSVHNHHPMMNLRRPAMFPQQLGRRLPIPQLPHRHRFGVRFPVRASPFGIGHHNNLHARRPAHPFYPRGYLPRPTARHNSYSTSLFEDEDEEDDDEFSHSNRTRYGWDTFEDLDEDEDDDDIFSLPETRRFAPYDTGRTRRYHAEWDDDDNDDFDDDDDDLDRGSHFGMGSHRRPYRPNYYSY
ncbi:hypothetical protein K505DRAFT_342539 [Melanomma pulvis-pyrius CBS 109.77]|uniref:Uncharacterized protein n=1 Tax=Melanomma pulvis-pyrius CBS 109.77 TaxID=1314802 RepID=A0A6A6WUV1_9PLEO|nr:hypothetical protein K505DRAFT_342539 [Melanomma pulvis-pyrius CBS 109.77]